MKIDKNSYIEITTEDHSTYLRASSDVWYEHVDGDFFFAEEDAAPSSTDLEKYYQENKMTVFTSEEINVEYDGERFIRHASDYWSKWYGESLERGSTGVYSIEELEAYYQANNPEIKNPWVEDVETFNETYNLPSYTLSDASEDHLDLLYNLILEEFQEFREAINARDTVETLDALADLLYVVVGAAVRLKMPITAGWNEVQRSNMSKVGADGKPIYREDGKLLKGPNFSKPDFTEILKDYE